MVAMLKKIMPVAGALLLTGAVSAADWMGWSGEIAGSEVAVFLGKEGTDIEGVYIYSHIGKPLKLKGSLDGKQLTLKEYDENNRNTGLWNVTLGENGGLSGLWSDKYSKYPVDLEPAIEQIPPANIKSKSTYNSIKGHNLFALQWISWQLYGEASVIPVGDGLFFYGIQRSFKNGNYIMAGGFITEVTADGFKLAGQIETFVDHNHNEACTRSGLLTFKKVPGRNYYRLQNMADPCSDVTDYIDVHPHHK